MRMAFETRTCRSFLSAQSLYTVEEQTPRRLAASRTERSLSHLTSSERIDCNPGVTRRLKGLPKPGQKSVLIADRFPGIPDGCEELPLSATPSSLPVTPEATGSSPVHPANQRPGSPSHFGGDPGPPALRVTDCHPGVTALRRGKPEAWGCKVPSGKAIMAICLDPRSGLRQREAV